jgi:predicted lipoprotein with Yx(FWY)xxD motif
VSGRRRIANRIVDRAVPLSDSRLSTEEDTMDKRLIAGALLVSALAVAACGDDGTTAGAPLQTPAEATAPGSTIAVKAADTPIATILTGPDGRTLYGFTNDADARSTCYDACAEAWPPVIVTEAWTVGPELDSGVFSTIPRDDGTQQLVAGKWPLYAYSGDGAPGDVNGQGSGDVWFVVGRDAKLLEDVVPGTDAVAEETTEPTTPPQDPYGDDDAPAETPAPAPKSQPKPVPSPAPAVVAVSVRTADTPLGRVMVDADGMTLYAFTKDVDGSPTCVDACANAWPASKVAGEPVTGEGISAALTTVDAPGGGKMVRAGKWPLYRFAGDAAPGDTNGQGSGGVWFIVAADGTLIR